MGCSLDTYRARIGRFGGTSIRIRKLEDQKSMIGKVFFSSRKMRVLFFSLWLVILAIAIGQHGVPQDSLDNEDEV